MFGRTIAIGDIHGCSAALAELLRAIDPGQDDRIIFLGDYIDRGPDSRAVLDQLITVSLECHVEVLLGNHEEMLLQVLAGSVPPAVWLRYGTSSTLESYGFDGDLNVIPGEHVEFLNGCKCFFETDTHFFVHANYIADRPLKDQPAAIQRWITLRQHVPGPHVSQKVAILGHTADKSGEIFDIGHLKCIDTYCYGGRWLTALDVEVGQVWQANQRGKVRELQLHFA